MCTVRKTRTDVNPLQLIWHSEVPTRRNAGPRRGVKPVNANRAGWRVPSQMGAKLSSLETVCPEASVCHSPAAMALPQLVQR